MAAVLSRAPRTSPSAIAPAAAPVGALWNPPMLVLLRSGTSELAQAPRVAAAASVATARRAVALTVRVEGVRVEGVGRPARPAWSPSDSDMASEPQVEAEPERPAGWEGSDIDVPCDRLVAEVADLGVQSLVLGPGDEVASLDGDRGRADTIAEARQQGCRQIVRQLELAELDERRVLHVDVGVPEPCRDAVGAERLRALGRVHHPSPIGRVAGEIVEQLRQVDVIAVVLPVEQEIQVGAVEDDVAAQADPVVGVGVADRAGGD